MIPELASCYQLIHEILDRDIFSLFILKCIKEVSKLHKLISEAHIEVFCKPQRDSMLLPVSLVTCGPSQTQWHGSLDQAKSGPVGCVCSCSCACMCPFICVSVCLSFSLSDYRNNNVAEELDILQIRWKHLMNTDLI